MVLLHPCGRFSWAEAWARVRAALAVLKRGREPEPVLLQGWNSASHLGCS